MGDWSDPRELVLGEADLALVHALQEDARAPWSRIADVLDADPGTLARRWAAINEAGWAWFTVWPSPRHHAERSDAALVRVRGEVAPDVVEAWCALPWVLMVERTSAGLCAVAVGSQGLADLESNILAAFAGSGCDVQIEYAASIAREDSSWRLRSLSAQQVARLAPRSHSSSTRPRPAREDVVAEMTEMLREDARMPFGAMASRLGVSEATARRTLERFVAEGLVQVGCDVSMPAAGLGRGAIVRLRECPSPEVARRVVSHPAVHRMISTVGPAEATVAVRMHSLTELREIERSWGDVDVVDRWTVTRPLKRNGHLLAADGRSTGHVDVRW